MSVEYLVAETTCPPTCVHHANPTAAWAAMGIAAWSLVLVGPRLSAAIRNRGPTIKGQALTGTARILSVRSKGASAYGLGWFGMALSESYVCMTALRVELPGREPYEVTIRANVPKRLIPDLQGGDRIVSVKVDPANLRKVRIDFDQPIK